MSEYQTDREYRAAIRKLSIDSESTLQKALNYLYDLRRDLTQAQSRIAVLEQELATSQAREAEARQVLERIANPISYLQEEAKRLGHQLNGAMAVRLTESPSWYREEASSYLATTSSGFKKEVE